MFFSTSLSRPTATNAQGVSTWARRTRACAVRRHYPLTLPDCDISLRFFNTICTAYRVIFFLGLARSTRHLLVTERHRHLVWSSPQTTSFLRSYHSPASDRQISDLIRASSYSATVHASNHIVPSEPTVLRLCCAKGDSRVTRVDRLLKPSPPSMPPPASNLYNRSQTP